MSNYVFLIDANKTPMNPIHPSHGRKLLESGKAAVFRYYPFTLIMNRVIENIITYPLTLKIDPGSKITGIALVNNSTEGIRIATLDYEIFLNNEIRDDGLPSSIVRLQWGNHQR